MKQSLIPVRFYKLPSGKEPVRNFLKDLDKKEKAKIGAMLLALQNGEHLSGDQIKSLGNGLWELRIVAPRGIRVIYCYVKRGYIALLHAFFKKTQKTPMQDLELAQERKRTIELLEAIYEKEK